MENLISAVKEWSLRRWLLLHIIEIGILGLVLVQFFAITGNSLKADVLDVGQGDAILIRTPAFKRILIDGGEDGKVIGQLSSRIPFFRPKIDLLILTHPHRDHFGGFLEVIRKYKVGGILLTGSAAGDPLYAELLKEIKEREIPMTFASSQKDLEISPGVFLDILYPFEGKSFIGQDAKNLNNTSIVARLTDADGAPLMLLSGDAEIEEEREIILSGVEISANILKAGHHGSRTATSDIFLSAVAPKTVAISAGRDNSFNHPHPETLEKLNAKNIETRITMDEGTITFNF